MNTAMHQPQKDPAQLLPLLLCLTLLFAITLPGCKKSDPPENNPPGNNNNNGNNNGTNSGSTSADTISNHLVFLNAAKKNGTAPKGPTGSSLEISFEDTLYLTDALYRPIKFRHKNGGNVAGVYVQIGSAGSGGLASGYYDVPEVSQMADNDSVSVIMIGIDPIGLEVPQTFDITITPYDEAGQPLAEAVRPVKLTDQNSDPNNASCGLVLPTGENWEWFLSYTTADNGSDTFAFYNDPFLVHSPGGQNIKGSCCNGRSTYPQRCPGDTLDLFARNLHFATYYQIIFETFFFSSNGTFSRQTLEDVPFPVPGASNFCGSGPGVVQPKVKHIQYGGDWTIQPVTLPPDLQHLASTNKQQLQLKGTSSTGTGFGNPGGVIHQLDCQFLTLIQLDRGGGKRHLIKHYLRHKAGALKWFLFKKR